MEKAIFRVFTVTLLCSVLAACASGPPRRDLDASVLAAQNLLAKFQNDPENEVLRDKLKEAKAILIVNPGIDRGVVLARKDDNQEWCGPAFYRITRMEAAGGGTGGAGFTAGRQDLELIALAMTDKALAWFMSPQLPGTSDMTFLPVTGTSSGGRGTADIVLFTRPEARKRISHFDGSNFDGAFVTIDQAGNQSYYGRPATPSEILIIQSVTSPNASSIQKAVAEAAH